MRHIGGTIVGMCELRMNTSIGLRSILNNDGYLSGGNDNTGVPVQLKKPWAMLNVK